jgi:hypothetical protein
MRLRATIAALALTIPAGADEPKKADPPKDAGWTKIVPGGKFEIEFPEKPTEKAAKTGTQYLVQKTNPTAMFLATATQLPAKIDLTKSDEVKAVFDNAAKQTERSLGGKVVSDKEGKVADKYPTRELDLEVEGIGIFRTRWVLTADGFLQVLVAGPKEFVDGPDAKRFMESLKIKE